MNGSDVGYFEQFLCLVFEKDFIFQVETNIKTPNSSTYEEDSRSENKRRKWEGVGERKVGFLNS